VQIAAPWQRGCAIGSGNIGSTLDELYVRIDYEALVPPHTGLFCSQVCKFVGLRVYRFLSLPGLVSELSLTSRIQHAFKLTRGEEGWQHGKLRNTTGTARKERPSKMTTTKS
jgi:hypothetical protein